VALALLAGLPLAACGGNSQTTSTWHSLRSVRVTVARPGLPPPYGVPKTTTFATPPDVARATSALNNFHIARRVPPSSNSGCAGGTQIEITIVPQQGRTASLNAYRCANQTTGDVAGNLPGFLSALGLPS
jgi:hypothetical protein